MSFATLQIGQCGNQFGFSVFDLISGLCAQKETFENINFLEESHDRFFNRSELEKSFARAILVDTEPKVLKDVTAQRTKQAWAYRPKNMVNIQNLGASNNWAMGYFCQDTKLTEKVLDIVRKETENMDCLEGLLLLLSVAGGTGSGFGSLLADVLQDEYSSSSMAAVTFWPFQKGDVSVQSYNATLSLASLQNSVDAIFVFDNDWLIKMCHHKLKIKSASLTDLNMVASQQLVNVLLPTETSCNMSPLFSDFFAHMAPHPQFKMIGLRSVPQEPMTSLPFSAYTWPVLLRSLRRMLLYNTMIDETYGRCNIPSPVHIPQPISLSNLLILRGRESALADPELLHRPNIPYSYMVPKSSRLKTWTHSLPFTPYDKTAVLANNGQMSISGADVAVDKAWTMFNHRAFFHHYEKCGLSSDDFREYVRTVEQLIASYKAL